MPALATRKRDKPLKPFIGKSQVSCLTDCLAGEEGDYFHDMLTALVERIDKMPKTYERDGLGDGAIVYLHYFKGSGDWYITEKDKGDPDDTDNGQHQAFGYADLGYGAEMGYISIAELIASNVEIDLYFTPTTVGELKAKGKIK